MIRSEIKLFIDIKLLVRLSSKETAQMDMNKLSYWENMWKLKFKIEKCKVLYIGSKYFKVECQLNNRNQKVDEKYDLGVCFNDTFKADKHILSIVLRANGVID